jgi:SecD/SecF fusion protein
VLVVGALAVALSSTPKLGLDLRGGTQIVLETRDGPTAKADADSTQRALEVLRRRVDALGVAEPSIARSGERRIIVELPGLQDPREAAEVIGRTAQLTFHPVLGAAAAPGQVPTGSGGRVVTDEDGQPLRIGPAALTGEGVSGADPRLDPQSGAGWTVSVDFRGSGEGAWQRLTGTAACSPPGDPQRRVAIVLDEDVISSPQVDPSIACQAGISGGSTSITGRFTPAEARDLAVLIKGGALPVPVEVIEQRTVGPTLGAAAIDASARAALIGVTLTALFMVFVYRLLGLLATVALCCYALLSYSALVAIGATLTLPGLAGFVLAIGMAVDANVLVFERAREEYAAGRTKSLRSALDAGFRGAWTAIVDSNVTTLLAAGLLFFLASGPVRGFGVTLSIGIIASMVSALVISRALAERAVVVRAVRDKPEVTGIWQLGRVRTWITGRNFDLMKQGRRWLAISALAAVVAAAGIAVRGLDLGVEFTGGRLVEYSTSAELDVERAREAVSDAGQPRAVVQRSGERDITVRTGGMSNDEVVEIGEALGAAAGGTATKLRDELIGPSLGDELRTKALIALAVALSAQLLYLAVRFRWTFGVAAVVAMAHDVVVLVGIFAWLGKPIDGVFWRRAHRHRLLGQRLGRGVRPGPRALDRGPTAALPAVANDAVLQTIPRTVNTGMSALFILTALAVLGGDSLRDFAVALLLGIALGTYSSMVVAAPLAVELEARSGAAPPACAYGAEQTAIRPDRRTDSGAVV